MKQILLRSLMAFIAIVNCTSLTVRAQNITGIWRGYFVSEDYSQYKFELQIEQKGTAVSGVSYSYLSTVFYGKATLTGSFSKNSQSALIREIKTVEVRMSSISQACIMKCIFQYDKSGREEFLEGTFTSTYEKTGIGGKRGEDCGGGKVYLRKVTTSDFYIEPFLRDKIKKTEVIIKTPVKIDTVAVVKKKPIIKNPPVVRNTIKNQPVTKINTPVKVNVDTLKKTETGITKIVIPPIETPDPEVLKTRENELLKTLIVSDPDVTVKLYDNGEIDDDTISVYLDKKLLLSNKRLTASPLTIKLKMDEDNPNHELVMVAENLGRIPPNTSLMIVESGEQRFDVRITSTEQKNAVVRFRYKKAN
ncbi:MAG TPA: hypothetical protein VLJ68_12365 [Chitinophagaceae bacterium]|nr:hypothetical protein [Chitinophagaceae bacterium]